MGYLHFPCILDFSEYILYLNADGQSALILFNIYIDNYLLLLFLVITVQLDNPAQILCPRNCFHLASAFEK